MTKTQTPNTKPIIVNNTVLEYFHEIKYVGLKIDHTLSWKSHILGQKTVPAVRILIYHMKDASVVQQNNIWWSRDQWTRSPNEPYDWDISFL